MRIPPKPITLTDLNQTRINTFWSKVNKTETCWLWTACVSKWGYGLIRYKPRTYAAHRLAYYFRNRVDPYPYLVLHTCDTPACVNPNHLFLGTDADNNADMESKGRAVSGFAKLTVEDVICIKGLLKLNKLKQYEIAKLFSISREVISQISTGRKWKDVIAP
jgi:hypothetical protein